MRTSASEMSVHVYRRLPSSGPVNDVLRTGRNADDMDSSPRAVSAVRRARRRGSASEPATARTAGTGEVASSQAACAVTDRVEGSAAGTQVSGTGGRGVRVGSSTSW